MKTRFLDVARLATTTLALLAGCATGAKYGAFEPKGEQGKPAPDAFADYGAAMAGHEGYKMAYEWQRENPKLVEEATQPRTIAAFAETPSAADALLAKIGTAYDGDPVALTQIAAVTQLVMCPKCPKAPGLRKIWVAALERTIREATDEYVRTFCRQQLQLCK